MFSVSSLAKFASEPESRKPSVLVVDDEQQLCDVACIWMEAFGLEATGAANADEALELLARQRFDLVFSDVVMPGSMNGVELAREVQMRFPRTPVILTSGYVGNLATKGLELPDGLIEKPYRKADLLRALQRIGLQVGD